MLFGHSFGAMQASLRWLSLSYPLFFKGDAGDLCRLFSFFSCVWGAGGGRERAVYVHPY